MSTKMILFPSSSHHNQFWKRLIPKEITRELSGYKDPSSWTLRFYSKQYNVKIIIFVILIFIFIKFPRHIRQIIFSLTAYKIWRREPPDMSHPVRTAVMIFVRPSIRCFLPLLVTSSSDSSTVCTYLSSSCSKSVISAWPKKNQVGYLSMAKKNIMLTHKFHYSAIKQNCE